ncbi:hypothetical protein Athai_10400 [Actinocatenispora thailandica]|uniref:DUF2804 domain-containing protein n=1 Tax=Actinocatenispora thailandica TaxID=227318 RepID=A0A7R7DKZ8_9ACTN|nr:DUF2804 domain-containing protein [Actinocatenispora thailandica]BCJ33537.1 hypothetical protein Athai_10400 [Actinocatenispora thailandica]
MAIREREITEPVELCTDRGRLNPAAVGWTRTPLHRANLRGWGRTKRWEYWGVVTPRHLIGLTVSSLDYAALHEIWIRDRETGVEHGRQAVVPLARGAVLPDRSGAGTVVGSAGALRIRIEQGPAGSVISARVPDVELELTVPLPAGHESLGVVVPWSARRFQYTVKDLGRPVHGTLRLGDAEHRIDAAGSFAVLDHGRGRWPYRISWNWAAGCAPGRGLQLGGRWTAGTGSTENALFVDGRLHKIGAELTWEYDPGDWRAPWRIHGDGVDVRFVPSHVKASGTNLGVVASATHQCFGHFAGWATTDDGTRVDLPRLVGWAEEANQRW